MSTPNLGTLVDRVPIKGSQDVVLCRFKGKQQAEQLGFASRDIIRISTAVSELARNIIQHAKASGEISFYKASSEGKIGIGILASDTGIGLSNPDSVLQQSNSIMSGGLYGTKKISHEFAIDSNVGRGTRVYFIRWLS